MTRIANTFSQKNKVLISYICAGHPDIDSTLSLMNALANNGTDIIELGVPFSDPMADGPIIQRATQCAVENGVTLHDVLAIVAKFRQNNSNTPVVLMGYLNPILRMGYEKFAQTASESGVDGVLTVDCPAEYIDSLAIYLKQYEISPIFMIAPTTETDRIQNIVKKAEGFIYCVSLKGVTGSARLDTDEVAKRISLLRQYTQVPIAVGFGIKTAEDAQRIASVADGIVVGSSFVQLIEQSGANILEKVAEFSGSLKNAIKS
ncbi:MAG: tryptophan synthase subunit alpha [Neisseriaceae bacterium]|nr:tryptophan synthase subunit alpha [Neisseriaceae bacterium]